MKAVTEVRVFMQIMTFLLTSIGIWGDLKDELFGFVIYSSTAGSDTVSILKTATELERGVGNTWNDIAVDLPFKAGTDAEYSEN